MMVVPYPILISGRRPGRLDAPDEAVLGQDAEGVVHRLAGDGADLGPHVLVDVVGGAVRSTGHRSHDRQTLRRDLQPVLTEHGGIVVDGGLSGHGANLASILEQIQIWSDASFRHFARRQHQYIKSD
jgi:hypothetical protein